MKGIIRSLTIGFILTFSLASAAQEKVTNVICIGNSFTYFHDSNLRLEEIAASQGHQLKTRACTSGGYTFLRHLNSDETLSAICYNQFDYAFLQDQSQASAVYARNPRKGRLLARDAAELAERVRCYSPGIKIWIEHTWAYPSGNFGGFESMGNFDRMLRDGTKKIARKARTDVSPIGEAFAIVRRERSDIVLYEDDQKHQSPLGTYLKACVNYLLIFGEAFHGEVTDCGYDAETCAYMRSVAERVVLNKERGI